MSAAQYRRLGHRAMLEEELQNRVMAAARHAGILAYHTHDSRRSVRGFPDVVLAGPGGAAFVELKREGRYPTPAQREWIAMLRASGHLAFVGRPRDMAAILELIKRLAAAPDTPVVHPWLGWLDGLLAALAEGASRG